jgi:FkbM family methyltransferase
MNFVYFEQYLRNIFGKDREKEIDLLCSLVSKTSKVIDVGANRGTYAFPLSKRIAKHGNLYLFEPIPSLYDYLKKGFSKKRFVKVFQLGCGAQSGKATIKIPNNFGRLGLGSGSLVNTFLDFKKLDIEILRIDDLNLTGIDFIKIDVEGYESFVLDGAIETIKKFRPIILIEIDWNMGNEYFDRLTKLVKDFDYRILSLTGNRFLEVAFSEFDSNKLNFHESGYRNNFFLIPSDRFKEVKNRLENQNYLLNYFRRFI